MHHFRRNKGANASLEALVRARRTSSEGTKSEISNDGRKEGRKVSRMKRGSYPRDNRSLRGFPRGLGTIHTIHTKRLPRSYLMGLSIPLPLLVCFFSDQVGDIAAKRACQPALLALMEKGIYHLKTGVECAEWGSVRDHHRGGWAPRRPAFKGKIPSSGTLADSLVHNQEPDDAVTGQSRQKKRSGSV